MVRIFSGDPEKNPNLLNHFYAALKITSVTFLGMKKKVNLENIKLQDFLNLQKHLFQAH